MVGMIITAVNGIYANMVMVIHIIEVAKFFDFQCFSQDRWKRI